MVFVAHCSGLKLATYLEEKALSSEPYEEDG